MLFVSGIHGVGKSFFCNRVKEQLGINTYSASTLIADKRNEGFLADKHVSNINENQVFLLSAIDELRNRNCEFILDGHFCLLDEDGNVSRIPMEVYTSLRPDRIILLTEQPSVIAARRLQRDGVYVDEKEIDSFQREEILYAEEVAEKLRIQLIVSTGSSDLEGIIQHIRKGGY